jgi:hypothetical protein
MSKRSAFSRVDETLLWEFVNIIHRKDIFGRILEKIFKYTNKIDAIITELTGVYCRNPLKEQDVQKEMEK